MDRYHVLERIGEGSFGKVYKARLKATVMRQKQQKQQQKKNHTRRSPL
jgi:serine/threonine protein kinase